MNPKIAQAIDNYALSLRQHDYAPAHAANRAALESAIADAIQEAATTPRDEPKPDTRYNDDEGAS